MIAQVREKLSAKMGELLGPRALTEVVITRFEDNTINYQIEGMRGPVPPAEAYQLLAIVAQQIAPHIPAPKETPSE